MNKENFIKSEFVKHLKRMDPTMAPLFGKMNVHQMIEHMSHAFQIASGKIVFENNQSPEVTEKMFRFMMSDKPFRDNTPNPNLSETPIPPRFKSILESLDDLQFEIDDFFEKYTANPDLKIMNPFFGLLNFEEQTHLLHKHALHHLRQFGTIV